MSEHSETTGNPYQAPMVEDVAAPVTTDGFEDIRRLHLKHEASLKAVGFLYLVGGILMLAWMLAFSSAMIVSPERGGGGAVGSQEMVMVILIGGVLVAIVGAQMVAGWGLRKLRPWATIPTAIVAGVGLLSIPVGTLFGIYVFYLLFCAKGRMVLSPGYREIVEATPHLRYRTPRWIWILLISLLVGMALLAFFAG